MRRGRCETEKCLNISICFVIRFYFCFVNIFFCFAFRQRFRYVVDQVGLQFTAIFLQLPECWNYRYTTHSRLQILSHMLFNCYIFTKEKMAIFPICCQNNFVLQPTFNEISLAQKEKYLQNCSSKLASSNRNLSTLWLIILVLVLCITIKHLTSSTAFFLIHHSCHCFDTDKIQSQLSY